MMLIISEIYFCEDHARKVMLKLAHGDGVGGLRWTKDKDGKIQFTEVPCPAPFLGFQPGEGPTLERLARDKLHSKMDRPPPPPPWSPT
jgi:hypothetical protein